MVSSTLFPHFGQYAICSTFPTHVLLSKYLKYTPHCSKAGKVLCALTAHSQLRERQNKLSTAPKMRVKTTKESLFSVMSVGTVLILIGIVFVLAQPASLWDSIVNFFNDLTWRSLPHVTGISLPAPVNPAAHAVVYTAAFQFCIGIGILQIVLLALRLVTQSPINKTSETVGDLVYWFGEAYLITVFLSSAPNVTQWFMFWAGILVMLGLSFFARAFVLLAKR
jgi:hypothetical protein